MVGGRGARRTRKARLAVLLAVLALPACAPTVTRHIDDATMTTRVKTALLNDPELGLLRLGVVTVDGVVTLTGGVRSEAQADRAQRLARTVDGVTAVHSRLVIRPDPRPEAAPTGA